MDLLDVQQPVPVLVSLLEGLLHPAASVSRTGTQQVSSGEGSQGSSAKNPFGPCPTTARSNAWNQNWFMAIIHSSVRSTSPSALPFLLLVPPLRTCSVVFKYCWAYSGVFFCLSLHSTRTSLPSQHLSPPPCTNTPQHLLLSSWSSWEWYRAILCAGSQLPHWIKQTGLAVMFHQEKRYSRQEQLRKAVVKYSKLRTGATEHAVQPQWTCACCGSESSTGDVN